MSDTNDCMIQRENLMKLLDRISSDQIIYICAPAGYGKTVAVRQLLEQGRNKGAVITLDELDNSMQRFCTHFCAGIKNCQPENAAFLKIIGHPAFESAPDEFTLRALDALSDDKRTCLVIDDLHYVHNEQVLLLLLVFLKRLRERFQLILVSRNELPPGFTELWMKGDLIRITAEELRFCSKEIKLLYKKLGFSITLEQADDIKRYTDGWAIGISAVLMSGIKPHGNRIEYLEKFIYDNIWRRWNEPVREFMLKTSVLREMTSALCNVLTGSSDSKEQLGDLIRQNAFISRTEQGTYQYHHLFQNFLRGMLNQRGEEFSRSLMKKAGHYYLAEQDFHNAIDYFSRCGDIEGLVQCYMLLISAGHEYYFIEKLLPVANSSMSRDIAEKCPYIYSMLSWAAFNEGRATDMAHYADLYYKNQNEIVRRDPRLALNIMLVRLIDFRITFSGLMLSAGEVFVIPMQKKLSDIGVSLGIINQNMPLLHRGTRDFSECAIGNVEENLSLAESVLGCLFGDISKLLTKCLLAGLLYEQGYIERAHYYAVNANAEIKKDTAPETKFFAMVIFVYILDALGQYEQADWALGHIGDMISQDGAYYLDYNYSALAVRRKLQNGNMEAACGWLAGHETAIDDNLGFYKLYGHLTTCRAYITKGDYEAAIALLKKVLELASIYNRLLDIIEAQTLLSIAYWKKKRGFQSEAMHYLEQAVSAACKYGYTQLFVNEGAELSGMLRRLQRRLEQSSGENPIPSSFVKMLYLKTQEHKRGGLTSGQASEPVKFTDRQMEVMALLCDGKSYREISEALGVTRPTLRSHIALIYKKLEVTSETEAVVKIKELGLLRK